MGTTSSAVATLGRATASTPVAPISAEARNALVWPLGRLGEGGAPSIVTGVLDHGAGGNDQPSEQRARVSAFLGVDCTLLGLAGALAAAIPRLPPPREAEVLSAETLAKAIVVFDRAHYRIESATDIDAFADRWVAGFRVPLPLEVDAGSRWVTDREAIERWAAEFDPRWTNLLTLPAGRLRFPDAARTAEQARARVEEALADGELYRALVTLRRALLLDNPSRHLFTSVALLRAFERSGARLRFCMDLLRPLSSHDTRMLGWTTAGNGFLRCAWRTLSPPAPSADEDELTRCRRVVAEGLGLDAAATPAGFHDPGARGPRVVPRELPLTAGQASELSVPTEDRTTYDGEPKRGLHVMMFGYYLHVGRKESYRGYVGPAYEGRLSPKTFAATCGPELDEGAPAGFAARCEIVLAISDIEGRLDACRAADAALLSTGIQQWSMHVNEEATVLLARYRDRNPDHYDLFFGMWRLQPRVWAAGGAGEAASSAGVAAANPDWNDGAPEGEGRRGYPSYVTLDVVEPGAAPALLPAKGPERRAFFGGIADARKVVAFGPDWCGRVRMAALVSPDYDLVQLQLAAYRFTRIARELSRFTVDVAGVPHRVEELCSSKLAAAALLDHHINSPGLVRDDLQQAAARTTAAETPHDPATGALTRAWLLRFAINYLAQRRFGQPPDWAIKADRDDWILRLHDNGLDPSPGSFRGWA